MNTLSRRALLKLGSALLPLQAVNLFASAPVADAATNPKPAAPIGDSFPSHPPELVREMVIVAHFDLTRVRELLEARPALARAAWDWGFGDWESALGAAAHMGNRPIAEYLIEKGARPSLFSAAMLGQLEVVKAFVAAQPGVQRIRGPHSISLFDHAKAGGDRARNVFEFLQSLGDAGAEAESALSEKDRAQILGTYVFGLGPSQQIDVTLQHNRMLGVDQLTWTRKGTMNRPLHHLGGRVFFPGGAEQVRIQFTEEKDEIVMVVNDPGPVLTARRRRAQGA